MNPLHPADGFLRWVLGLWMLWGAIPSAVAADGAAPVVIVRPGLPRQMLGDSLEILRDPGRAWTILDVQSPQVASGFRQATTTSPAFGYSTDAYWVRFRLRSAGTEPTGPVVQLETSRFADLEWYMVTDSGKVVTPTPDESSTHPMRILPARLPAILMELAPGQEVSVYLRAWTPSSTFFPIFVHADAVSYTRAVVIGEALWLPFLGVTGAVALLSVYFGFLFRQRLFFINALLIVLYCAFLSIHSGYWEWLDWWGSPGIKWQPMLLLSQLNSLTILWFNIEYFQVAPLGRYRRPAVVALLVLCVSTLWLPFQVDAQWTNWMALLVYLLCLGLAVSRGALRPGGGSGRLGVHLIGLAWLADVLFVALLIVQWQGWMPMIVSPPTGLLYPAAVSPLLVLAAVADRFYQLTQEQMRMQALEQSLSEARFQALRYQMNPHFLYNALNSVRGLLLESPQRAEDFVVRLARFLRSSLSVSQETLVPLYRELEILGNYLDVEKVRFEDRLEVHVEVPASLDAALVPELVFQPLVENAIKHGSLGATGRLQISVTVLRKGDHLVFEVSNSGRLKPETSARSGGTRVGLENLRRRLDLVFPGRGDLVLFEDAGRVVARVVIPFTSTDDTSKPADDAEG